MTAAYMSDEETDCDDEGFIIRKPSWRSDLLNKLLLRLDKQYEDKRKSATSRSKPKEKRKSGTFSTRQEPEGIPKWAFKKACESSPSSSGVSGDCGATETCSRTPTSTPGHTAQPAYLFNDYSDTSADNDSSSTDDESDDELSTMIRAATMKLY